MLLARAGLILGPYEDIGRLPWWLNRLARGGPTLAPGPGELHDFLHGGDTGKAYANGLVCRPVRDTVTDTWTWLRGLPGGVPQRADRLRVGLDPRVEAKVLGE